MGILKKSTEESDNPDLRDRGYIYWRMLSTDPQATKFVVLGDKPEFNVDENDGYDEAFLENLIENISHLSSIYHITPDDIEIPQRDQRLAEEAAVANNTQGTALQKAKKIAEEDDDESDHDEQQEEGEDDEEEQKGKPRTESRAESKTKPKILDDTPVDMGIEDLLGLGDSNPVAQFDPLSNSGGGWAGDFLGSSTTFHQQDLYESYSATKPNSNGVSGLQIKSAVNIENNHIFLVLDIANKSGQTINQFQA